MATCEFTEKCSFFNGKMENMPAGAEDLKTRYCKESNLNCARYMVATALGNEKVPPSLLPTEKDAAYLAIAQG